jgi:hypothetical protein
MAETVRQVVIRRERAARSPAMERALKRLIWRYSGAPRGIQTAGRGAGPAAAGRAEDVTDRPDRDTQCFEDR